MNHKSPAFLVEDKKEPVHNAKVKALKRPPRGCRGSEKLVSSDGKRQQGDSLFAGHELTCEGGIILEQRA